MFIAWGGTILCTASGLLLLLDNKDSFVWNLAQALQGLGAAVSVVRSDAIDVERAGQCRAIVVSPGPGDSTSAQKAPAASMSIRSLRTTLISAPRASSACARFQTNESLLSSSRIKPAAEYRLRPR